MEFDLVQQQGIEVQNHMVGSFRKEIAGDVSIGLTSSRKFIPSKYFYDARGSRLFEEICSLPEYYPTRTEISILRYAAPEIMGPFESGDIVELGSGANKKIRMLLDSAGASRLQYLRYVPVDVSKTALIAASEELVELYPGLSVLGIVADFTLHLDAIPGDRPRMFIFFGSTIGNFDEESRMRFLRHVADTMNPGDRFIAGFDMLKPKEALESAYNDSRGITSEFNKNVLHVLNRELNADFRQSHFDHMAFFNEEKGRVEMHLRANREISVRIGALDLDVSLEKGETIHTEVCAKFSEEDVEQIVSKAGLYIEQWFFDSRKWFSIVELAKGYRKEIS
ncbi:MAG TPA: L-histidine N(alpha)-methyltransferase [Nitrospirae bacterium]|nr:histidine-specific methyltransferase EgtD [bacterium BMS3Abin06]HDH12446.1 L-histidine N(alpha)-methyltransferase [Nitrospirota bacterium]HDZ02417.1 L-histidine N(alpha)-methyltransferase [Nitrospirota bacterium]